MGNNKCILIFLWCCVAHEFVDAKGGMQELLDSQFMNITTDIKLEAQALEINPDDVNVVEVLKVYIISNQRFNLFSS